MPTNKLQIYHTVTMCAVVILALGTIYTLVTFDLMIYALLFCLALAVVAFIYDKPSCE